MNRSRLRSGAVLLAFVAASRTQSQAFQDANPAEQNSASVPAAVEQIDSSIVFASDGTSQAEHTVKVRTQSDADLKRYSVVTMPYLGGSERAEISVRVTKPDGSITETPDADIQDLPAAVTRRGSDLWRFARKASACERASGRRSSGVACPKHTDRGGNPWTVLVCLQLP